MCGILGTVDLPFDERTLDLIRHRGPDDFALSTTTAGGHTVTLGHRRLSILDLSPAGRQPMWTRCGRFGIIFNGEVYNHRELRDTGIEYRGHSDTETILNYLSTHGAMAARHLNGIFALGLIDVVGRKLFLIRDPFGVKPLYYSASPQACSFGSELRPLRTFSGEKLDTASLAELLRLRYLPAPDTLYKDIWKVRPGHIVEVDLSRPALAWREYPFAERRPLQHGTESPEEIADKYHFLVNQAVRRQLLSDVEIGVLLSGGVDSALIASLAQNASSARMKAFTVGFDGNASEDEITDARESAAILGLEHHEIRMGAGQFFDLLPTITSIVEEPLATTSVVPMYYLSELAASHVKVVLSGQGADESMGGYRRYRGELLRSALPKAVIPVLRAGARWGGVKHDAVLRGLESLGETDDLRRFESTYGVFGGGEIQRLIGQEPVRAADRIRYFFELLRCADQTHSVERMMTLDLRMNLADDLLLYTDRITMRHSLECRVPLLDIELVEWVESLPKHYRVSMFNGKILHKQIARRVLPEAIVTRKKKGFFSPAASWFRQSGTVRDLLLSRNSRFSSHFDLDEVTKVLDQHAAGLNRERHLFLLLGVYHWMEECLGSTSEPATRMNAA